MSFFSLDSKFSQIMGRVFDLMMLNIIFLIMCIPIVTIGANFTAMYYVTLKMIKNEETYIFRTYWKSFRENFKQATAIWLILLAVLIVLILDLLLVMRMPGTITYLRFVFLVLIFFEAMVLSYVFPVLSRFDNTVKNTIKNSILMAIRHLPWTIMILLVNLCPLLIYVFSTTKIVSYLILLMFLLGFSTVALGCSWFFVNKIFPFYMPEEENEVLILLNSGMEHMVMQMVCGHEIGHDVFHRDLAKKGNALPEFTLFDMRSKPEYEANAFAAHLIIDNDELVEYMQEGYDVVQLSAMMGTNINLMLIKLNEMNRMGWGLNLPYVPHADFLKQIKPEG